MAGVSFCEKCGSIIAIKRDARGKQRPFCNSCGFKDKKINTEAYKLSFETEGSNKKKVEVIEIDRQAELDKLKKTMGERHAGPSCPNCRSFYLTKSLQATRGDEPGRVWRHCLSCGYSFRRAKWVGPENE